MKRIIFLVSLLCFSSLLQAQKDYKVVFDLTSRDSVDHKNIIRWLNEMTAAEPNANLEVVLYGKSLDMVTKDKSVVSNAVQQLAARPNVAFKVCAIAMKNNNVDKSQSLKGQDL